MNYAFIDSMGSLTYNNGIKIQAIMWKEGLENIGEDVTLVNLWENINFSDFDAVIIFAMGANIFKLVNNLSRINKNIILAPIIDPDRSDKIYRFFFRYYGSTRLALSNHFHDMWAVRDKVRLWLVRSEQERHYVNYCLGIPQNLFAFMYQDWTHRIKTYLDLLKQPRSTASNSNWRVMCLERRKGKMY